jgi:CRISPR/Cas system Type II protein with McrA/HNH and RuvC-like nuclease domain
MYPLVGIAKSHYMNEKQKEICASMTERQSFEVQIQQKQAVIGALERQLRDALRVIDVLVAVGKLKQGHVEEARSIVSSLSE